MPEAQLLPYALTTLDRVKALIPGLDNSNFDVILQREINAVTEYLEQECNRRFAMTFYISEQFSQWGSKQKFRMLRHAPVFFLTDIVTIVGGQNTVTLNNVNGVQKGMPIYGDGILPGTKITDVTGSVITISNNFIFNSTDAHIFINGLTSLQYRAGTPDQPNWTSFFPPQFETVDDAKAGIVRIYGWMSSIFNNTVKGDYWAGYLINWKNAGDGLTHTLPADITRTCENIVIRQFKRREQAGKSEQSLESTVVRYDRQLDQQDLDTIKRYRRVPTIM